MTTCSFHNMFKSQEDYDKTHAKLIEIKSKYENHELTKEEVINILSTKFRYGVFGCNHVLEVWEEEFAVKSDIIKRYKNKKIGKTHAIEELFRHFHMDRLDAETLLSKEK